MYFSLFWEMQVELLTWIGYKVTCTAYCHRPQMMHQCIQHRCCGFIDLLCNTAEPPSRTRDPAVLPVYHKMQLGGNDLIPHQSQKTKWSCNVWTCLLCIVRQIEVQRAFWWSERSPARKQIASNMTFLFFLDVMVVQTSSAVQLLPPGLYREKRLRCPAAAWTCIDRNYLTLSCNGWRALVWSLHP